MKNLAPPAILAGVCFGLGLAFGTNWNESWVPLAVGQNHEEASREKLYSELAVEAEAMDRHSRVLSLVSKLVGPAVVHIEATKGTRRTHDEAGSGVIVEFSAKPGRFYVLTNGHVISDAPWERIKIKLADGRELTPRQVWIDTQTDVAVMEISGQSLSAARIGNSQQVEIGDFVLAVGSPFGLSHSVTFGIISAKGRRDLDLGNGEVKYKEFMQTDAAINPGNSGGPLVNLRGEVIGINTAIASNSGGSEGIGFSIPINMAATIAEQLILRGAVARAYLGVTLNREFTPTAAAKLGLRLPHGAHVTHVSENTPAAAAKLLPGDVILEFDGIRIEDDVHLVNLVSLTPVGKQVQLRVWRDGRAMDLLTSVGDREKLSRTP